MKLQKDLREFIELLNGLEARYLVVGAFAVAYHGHPRYTGDIDLFIKRPQVGFRIWLIWNTYESRSR